MTDTPMFTECVIGYRQWRLADWVLAPLSVGHPWKPGVNRARCQKQLRHYGAGIMPRETTPVAEAHKAPDNGCDCGLYGLHDIPTKLGAGMVLGAIAGWGDLQVHHRGFRAEFAQVVALAQRDDDLTEVAQAYGVPVVPLDMLKMEAERHGQSLPMSARPEKPAPVGSDALRSELVAQRAMLKAIRDAQSSQKDIYKTWQRELWGAGSSWGTPRKRRWWSL